jgi:hypothetical protein
LQQWEGLFDGESTEEARIALAVLEAAPVRPDDLYGTASP